MTIQQAINDWKKETGREIGEWGFGVNCFNIYYEDGGWNSSAQVCPEDEEDLIMLWDDYISGGTESPDCVTSIEEAMDLWKLANDLEETFAKYTATLENADEVQDLIGKLYEIAG